MMTDNKKIVVFGETGVGKSSVINMLIGNNVAEISKKATGCTFEYKAYETADLTLYDTAGLAEGTSGTVDAKTATKNLIELLTTLKDGINLLVFVIKQGKITASLQNINLYFAEIIFKKKVPVLLVVTHCERSIYMNEYWVNNESIFRDKYKMNFASCVCVCASQGENLEPDFTKLMRVKYESSRLKLSAEINQHSSILSVKLELDFNSLLTILRALWNIIIVRVPEFVYDEFVKEVLKLVPGQLAYDSDIKNSVQVVLNLNDHDAILKANEIFNELCQYFKDINSIKSK